MSQEEQAGSGHTGSALRRRRGLDLVFTVALMQKLLEIQRRAGSDDGTTVRALALEAQDDLLELERSMIAALADNDELRRRMEQCEQLRDRDQLRALRAG